MAEEKTPIEKKIDDLEEQFLQGLYDNEQLFARVKQLLNQLEMSVQIGEKIIEQLQEENEELKLEMLAVGERS